MDGFLNLLKPPGMTSSDLVLRVRKMLPRGTKVGHGGTLDPDAAGVLPVCVGRAARLFDYIIDKKKTYVAELTLGVTTDTQDATGKVLRCAQVTQDENQVRAILPRFIGDIMQIPPAFSAIKRDGKRQYELARKGEAVELEPRPVRVEDIRYLRKTGENSHMLEIDCRKGVYIRTICHDIGEALGCGGHMSFLLRSRAGVFDVENAVTPEELAESHIEELLIPLDVPLMHLPQMQLGEACRHAVKNGNPIRQAFWSGKPETNGPIRVYLEGEFVGIGQIEGQEMRFAAVLREVEA